jgi:hypothetical protein
MPRLSPSDAPQNCSPARIGDSQSRQGQKESRRQGEKLALRRCRAPLLVSSSPCLLVFLCLIFALAQRAHAQVAEDPISQARARGIKYIKERQKPDGSWEFTSHDVGISALCTIALIENGMPLADSAVQKGYEYVKKNCARLTNTYDLSLVIVLLSRYGDRRDKPQIKSLAARLIAGQMTGGGWHYTCPGQDLDVEKVLKDPGAGPKPKEGYGDNSCTQFAVLGLWVASRSGVNIDKPMAKVVQRFTSSQSDDGGWAYVAQTDSGKAPSGPSMTGAGLFCLAVAEATQIRESNKSGKKTEGKEAPARSLMGDKVFSRGLKRTGDFVQGIGPDSQRYFLWSIERVGVLLGLEKFGETDWFHKGSDALLKSQAAEGNWPTAWGDTDKAGLTDTCLAILFLRKANLGSDVSRLLEGEHSQKFSVLGREPAARFDSLEEAVADAKAGETIRIDGSGPYKLGHLELTKDLTIQAGFGYQPVFKFEIGRNRLGIKLKPESDPNARDMISIASAGVTLEGIRLQMDTPAGKQPIPWRGVTIKSGSLRLLNCTISETNKQGMSAIVDEAPGRLVVRNSLLIGGKAGIEFAGTEKQNLVLDNSMIFSNAGFLLTRDPQSKSPVDLSLEMVNSAIQAKSDVVQLPPKLAGTIEVTSRLCAYQADWLSSTFLPAPDDAKGRSWKGSVNLYDVTQWIGSDRKSPAKISDAKGWMKFWKNGETGAVKGTAPFIGHRQFGSFAHDTSAQDWQLEFPANADVLLQRSRVGVNSYQAGPGQPYDLYRETIAYSDWLKGRLDLAAADAPASGPAN